MYFPLCAVILKVHHLHNTSACLIWQTSASASQGLRHYKQQYSACIVIYAGAEHSTICSTYSMSLYNWSCLQRGLWMIHHPLTHRMALHLLSTSIVDVIFNTIMSRNVRDKKYKPTSVKSFTSTIFTEHEKSDPWWMLITKPEASLMQTFSKAKICPANDVIIDWLMHKPVGHQYFGGNYLSIMASPHWQPAFQDQWEY